MPLIDRVAPRLLDVPGIDGAHYPVIHACAPEEVPDILMSHILEGLRRIEISCSPGGSVECCNMPGESFCKWADLSELKMKLAPTQSVTGSTGHRLEPAPMSMPADASQGGWQWDT